MGSGHCVPIDLRAVAQDQRYRQFCQPGVEVSLAEDKESVGGQVECPFSQGTCPCTRRGWSPPWGLVYERHGVHLGQKHAGALLRATQTCGDGTEHREASTDRGGALRAPSLTRTPLRLDPEPMGARDTQRTQTVLGILCCSCGPDRTRLPQPFPTPSPEDGAALTI